MDRLMHTTAVRSLPLLLALFSLIPAGCKSTKSDVSITRAGAMSSSGKSLQTQTSQTTIDVQQ